MSVIPATTKVDKFAPITDPVSNRVLTVGRLVEKKGYEFGLKAIANLINEGYNIEYHIVGKGELQEALEDQVRSLGIDNNVKFQGHVSDYQLKKELSEATIFLLPCVVASDGDRDAMPVALKEAMASKTPCISTYVSAIPELISSGDNGLLVPPRDPNATAKAIKRLLNSPSDREKFAENGYETVKQKFDISRSVDRLVDVFKTTVVTD